MTVSLRKPTLTERVLAGMFTENTGSHFLDSGSAYGRNWQRNAGRTAVDFLARPKVTLDARFEMLDVTVDTFHWLNDKVEHAPDMQRKFEMFVTIRDAGKERWDCESWFEALEAFTAAHNRKYGEGYMNGTVNTYNGESSLSQTLQYTVFTGPDDEGFVALQVHGGCDVRGGYTAPKMFRVYDEPEHLWDTSRFNLYCEHGPEDAPQAETLPGMPVPPHPDEHFLDYDNGDWTDSNGSYSRDPWKDRDVDMFFQADGESFVRCPYSHQEPHAMVAGVMY